MDLISHIRSMSELWELFGLEESVKTPFLFLIK